MKIVIIGRENVGGGLAAQWRRTGHQEGYSKPA
jgi:predicted dinucleotide-binding enzyme